MFAKCLFRWGCIGVGDDYYSYGFDGQCIYCGIFLTVLIFQIQNSNNRNFQTYIIITELMLGVNFF